MKTVRVANGQGFWGDNVDAPLELVRGGPVDYLGMDYLAEVTLSIVLLVGAGLLLASFASLQRATLGFDPRGTAAAFVSLPPARYATPAQQAQFFEQVTEALRAQPGVTDAA